MAAGAPSSYDLSGYRQGLKDAGFVEGKNLLIEYRWGNDDPALMSAQADDLVRRRVQVIVAAASGLVAHAAQKATGTIPIVFGFGIDPVQQGLVTSLNHPGGNVTGVTSRASELFGKQISLFHELVPQATRVGVLANSVSVQLAAVTHDSQSAASALGLSADILTVATAADIDGLFARLAAEKRIEGLIVSNDPLFIAQRVQLATLAAQHALPAIYPFREMAVAGGLMSYGPNLAERDREAGRYVGRILRGEKPGDLPVEQMSKFALVINMKAARALGLPVSNSLQLLADEVIE